MFTEVGEGKKRNRTDETQITTNHSCAVRDSRQRDSPDALGAGHRGADGRTDGIGG